MKRNRLQKRSLSKKIKEAVSDFDSTPFEINSGQCRDFAERVQGTSKKKGIKLLSHIDKLDSENNHCFIKFKRRYYDAEVPRGVSTTKELPFFIRKKITPKSVRTQ